MKNKVITFIIGMLVGAIIAAGGFFIYQKVSHPKGMRGDRPEGMAEFREGEEPPEKPDDDEERPARRGDKQNTTNTSEETTSEDSNNSI